MKKYEKIYKKLREKYTEEEIADGMLIPADLTKEEKEAAESEMREIRFKILREQTEEDRLHSDLLRFRFQLEDYLKSGNYNPEQSFGKQLNEYVRILKKSKKELSEDLGVHYTRLSRILNDREEPNVELAYRLEKHSGNLIPAIVWWKIIIKKQEYEIRKDNKTRKKEWSKVQGAVTLRA